MAGDDGANPTGTGCNVKDLCQTGWHVCSSSADVADSGAGNCQPGDFVAGFYATRQSGPGYAACGLGANDLFGCGSVGANPGGNCGPLNRFSNDGCTSLGAPWSCGGTANLDEGNLVTKGGAANGGVLCCRGLDPCSGKADGTACDRGLDGQTKVCGGGSCVPCERTGYCDTAATPCYFSTDCPDGDFCQLEGGIPNPRYVDNGDGTITDRAACLVWEKKCSSCGNVHDVTNSRLWNCDGSFCQPAQAASDACYAGATTEIPEVDAFTGCELCGMGTMCGGSTVWESVATINDQALAGHHDWRMPSQIELLSLLAEPHPCNVGPPCVDSTVGPTASSLYWSSTTSDLDLDALGVSFDDGADQTSTKFGNYHFRAVRGAAVCDAGLELSYASLANPNPPGAINRVRVKLSSGEITGLFGVPPVLNITQVAFDLDCTEGSVPEGCTDDGNFFGYVGNVTTTCPVSWSAQVNPGNSNQILFNPNVLLTLSRLDSTGCELEFDVTPTAIMGTGGDATPFTAEQRAFFSSAECPNGLPGRDVSTVAIAVFTLG